MVLCSWSPVDTFTTGCSYCSSSRSISRETRFLHSFPCWSSMFDSQRVVARKVMPGPALLCPSAACDFNSPPRRSRRSSQRRQGPGSPVCGSLNLIRASKVALKIPVPTGRSACMALASSSAAVTSPSASLLGKRLFPARGKDPKLGRAAMSPTCQELLQRFLRTDHEPRPELQLGLYRHIPLVISTAAQRSGETPVFWPGDWKLCASAAEYRGLSTPRDGMPSRSGRDDTSLLYVATL